MALKAVEWSKGEIVGDESFRGTRIRLEKATRCTEPGDQAADLLSKRSVEGARKKCF